MYISLICLCLISTIILVITYIVRQRIIVCICCIDERVLELIQCLDSIGKEKLINFDLLGVFRKKDVLCSNIMGSYGGKTIHVQDYASPPTTINTNRHNYQGLVIKRNAALQYARKNGYTKLIFIDSDISISSMTFLYLLLGTIFVDISCIPYCIRWAGMKPVLGYINPNRISFEKGYILPFHRCYCAGMGCTCINLNSKRIPNEFIYEKILGIQGEDIGFFKHALSLNARVWAANWSIVSHI